MRRLFLVIGPNGAGKTTFVTRFLSTEAHGLPFVNADVIARERWPDAQVEHAYDAARIAEQTRARLIEAGASFIAETVASHPSKLELISAAQAAGYQVRLRVVLVPEELSVARVRYRVAAGGHDVPVGKIRERYQRIWPIVAEAINRCDDAILFDNSRAEGHRIIARFVRGDQIGNVDWPKLTPTVLTDRWPPDIA